ncbi:MAG: hypothetical protein P8Z77_04975 [Candidatus Thiodiazotropha sp.]
MTRSDEIDDSLDLSTTDAIARELNSRGPETTCFVIKLASSRLLEHFEQRMNGIPLQFIQQAPV